MDEGAATNRYISVVLVRKSENPQMGERHGATAESENVGEDNRWAIGDTGSTINDLANLGSDVSNWHVELINCF